MMTDVPVSADELSAYVDGQIGEERRAAIEAWLERSPADRERVQRWRKLNQLIRSQYTRAGFEHRYVIIDRPAPAGSKHAVGKTQSRAERVRRAGHFALVAAVSGFVAAFVAFGLVLTYSAIERTRVDARGTFLGIRSQQPARTERGAAPLPAVLFGDADLSSDDGDPTLSLRGQTQALRLAPSYFGVRMHTPTDMFDYAAQAYTSLAAAMHLRYDFSNPELPALGKYLASTIGPDLKLPECPKGLKPLGVRVVPGERGLAGFVALDAENVGRVGIYMTRSGAHPPSPPVFIEKSGLSMVNFITDRVSVTIVGRNGSGELIQWANKLRDSLVPQS